MKRNKTLIALLGLAGSGVCQQPLQAADTAGKERPNFVWLKTLKSE